MALTLNNLGVFYKGIGRCSEARPVLERALVIFPCSSSFKRALGGSDTHVAATLINLAHAAAARSTGSAAKMILLKTGSPPKQPSKPGDLGKVKIVRQHGGDDHVESLFARSAHRR